MNFFSEKKTIYLWTRGEDWRCRESKSKSKVEDRWRLNDNIFAYDTFIYPKKAKVNLMNLGWGSQPQRRAAFNRVWENIFMNSDRYECWNYKFQKQRGVFDKDVERGRQRGVFDKDVERWGWLPHPKFIGSQPQSSLPHTLFILPKLDFHQASNSGCWPHEGGAPCLLFGICAVWHGGYPPPLLFAVLAYVRGGVLPPLTSLLTLILCIHSPCHILCRCRSLRQGRRPLHPCHLKTEQEGFPSKIRSSYS